MELLKDKINEKVMQHNRNNEFLKYSLKVRKLIKGKYLDDRINYLSLHMC
jgi:hypothetical protein